MSEVVPGGLLPDGRKQLQQMAVAHQVFSEPCRDFRQASLNLVHELDVVDWQEVHECHPDLRYHGFFACPKEDLDPKVLLYPLEERMNWKKWKRMVL